VAVLLRFEAFSCSLAVAARWTGARASVLAAFASSQTVRVAASQRSFFLAEFSGAAARKLYHYESWEYRPHWAAVGELPGRAQLWEHHNHFLAQTTVCAARTRTILFILSNIIQYLKILKYSNIHVYRSPLSLAKSYD
jgi:hypothetical protein